MSRSQILIRIDQAAALLRIIESVKSGAGNADRIVLEDNDDPKLNVITQLKALMPAPRVL